MDFRLGSKSDAFRAEVRSFLDEHLDPEVIERAHRTGTMHDKDFHRGPRRPGLDRRLVAGRIRRPGARPVRDDRPARRAPARRRAHRRHGAVDDRVPDDPAGRRPTSRRRDFIPRALAGEIIMSLGYSEPDSGSDVASIKTRAVRDGDEWVINGQKMFTTLAHEANYVFLLARTNHDVAKHRGLTMFLVPLDSPGIEIHPVHTVGGERTNATFYNDVRVTTTTGSARSTGAGTS